MESKWKQLAEKNTILRAVVGSTAHGLNLPGHDDRDEMGVCLEPLEAFAGFHEFEQFIFRSAEEREGKHDAPSQAGDLDLTIYSMKKFLRLAMQGNPSVLLLLYVDQLKCVVCNALGQNLKELAPEIISRQAGKRFLGYMEAQKQRLMGERGQKKVNRPELEEAYGYDTKYAMHILRLGFQGVELLDTGKLVLPMSADTRALLMRVREGKVTLNEVLNLAGDLKQQLEDLLTTSPLPERANEEFVEQWMIERYWQWWRSQRYVIDSRSEAAKLVM